VKHINGQNSKSLNVKAGGTYSYHRTVEGHLTIEHCTFTDGIDQSVTDRLQMDKRDSVPGNDRHFFFATLFTPVLGPTKPNQWLQGIKQEQREAQQLHHFSTEVRMHGVLPSIWRSA
jgi:hypothetical protein